MSETRVLQQKERPAATTPESTRGVQYTPRVDICETVNELMLYADVPGVRPEDVDLRYQQGELHLHCRVQPRHRDAEFLLQEYGVGDFYRVFTIHESIDSTRIEAGCKNGVLVVHLPKMEAVKPRQINVKA